VTRSKAEAIEQIQMIRKSLADKGASMPAEFAKTAEAFSECGSA